MERFSAYLGVGLIRGDDVEQPIRSGFISQILDTIGQLEAAEVLVVARCSCEVFEV